MKKYFLTILFFCCISLTARPIEISRIEPAFWWTGMKNPELQIMVFGYNIGGAKIQFSYPGVELKRVIQADSPDYLFLYFNITPMAQPGKMKINFIEGKKKLTRTYELKARNATTGAQGFDTSDVLYLIMPDRFANGKTSNDNWGKVKVNRKEPFARHGGDFAGIGAHLDYIRDLGVTTLWLNPVLENKMPEGSYHGYATTDFYRVDQRFGSNEDYRLLIEQIHRKGMKMVMDMIYNHCGSSHWWMENLPCIDWLNHQDGYVQTSYNVYPVVDVHASQADIGALVNGWFVSEMPDLNQRNPLLATYLIQNSIWWIEYARIDGIRHDTHPYADKYFLSRWCKAITDEYPDFNIVGESWYINTPALAWWQRNSPISSHESNLKTVMDFNLMNACNEAFAVDPKENNSFRKIYEVLVQDFLYADLDNILIFLDNHDLSRFIKKEETGLNRYKQALAFMLTTRGIPQLYYGTEILMYGEKNEGDGNLRKDFPGGWPGDPVNAFSPSGRSDLQNEAWNYLQKLLQWRKQNPAVKGGKLIHYVPDNSDCYVYARIKGNDKVLVILNGSNQEQRLSPERYREVIGDAVSGKEIISGNTISLKDDISIAGKGVNIIEL